MGKEEEEEEIKTKEEEEEEEIKTKEEEEEEVKPGEEKEEEAKQEEDNEGEVKQEEEREEVKAEEEREEETKQEEDNEEEVKPEEEREEVKPGEEKEEEAKQEEDNEEQVKPEEEKEEVKPEEEREEVKPEEEREEVKPKEEIEQVEKWMSHYSSKQRILLVGEGDFSFSLCLARAFGFAGNMVATCLDTQVDLDEKYDNGLRNVRELEERGCLVLYGVDVKEMSQHWFLSTRTFDRIIFNFPHVGFLRPENNLYQIQLNEELVESFMENARVLLEEDEGEIHVSHKEGYPYNRWGLVVNAENKGLVLRDAVRFCKDDYPDYHNKRGSGSFSDRTFKLGLCRTYKFKKLS